MSSLNTSDTLALKALEKELGSSLQDRALSRRNGYTVIGNQITEIYLNEMQLETLPEALGLFKHLEKISAIANVLRNASVLAKLSGLKSINVANNNLTDIDFAVTLSELEDLQVYSNRLTVLPDLSQLVKLISININHNLLNDFGGIGGLPSLISLEAYGNKIDHIDHLAEVSTLQICNLGSNSFTEVAPLSKLVHLDKLFIQFNDIDDPEMLAGLVHLTKLDMTFCRLEDLEWIRGLRALNDLNLNYNHIVDISPLADLKELVFLDLSHNPLDSLETLRELPQLRVLSLEKALPADRSPLQSLSALATLNLTNNKLKGIGFVGKIKSLQSLTLTNNKLTNIDSIGKLPKLTQLNIENNLLRFFPRWILESPMDLKRRDDYGNGVSLDNNPIEDVPTEFIKDSKQAVGDYLKSLENGSAAINEIKVIVLGEGAAGKTSLVNFLQGKKFNKLQSQTHGINIAECGKDLGVTMKIWDFGGQDIMHHTHQLFLTQNSVYVLVINARENTDTEKWLKLVKVFGGDSPVIIVTNKIDENPSSHENIRFFNTKYPNINNRYARISCQSGEGLEDFKIILEDTIKELLHVRTQWGLSWLTVKTELEKMRRGKALKDYIHYDKYEEIAERHGVFPNHRDTLINWLHQLGVVTYFPDTHLNETNVINPSWLTEAFYAIINAKKVAQQFGRFNAADIGGILDSQKYPKQKYGFLLGLMTKFELCFQIDADTYLIPDLLQKEEPTFHFPIKTALKFKYKYQALLPKAVLPKFMVRRHQEIFNNQRWRTGLTISDKSFSSKALIRMDEEEKEIAIFVSGQEQRGYLASILSSFQSINELYDGLEYEQLVPCSCRTCRDSETPFYHKYSLLAKLKENGRPTTLCEKTYKDVSVNELLGILITPGEMEEEIKKLVGSGAFLTKKYLEENNLEAFITTIKSLFASVSYLLFEKSEKAYHTPLFLMLRSVFGNLSKADEIQSKGRSDIVVNLADRVYIFEIKLDGSTDDAISQIYNNRYYEPYLLEEKPIELIGLNFSSTERNIESYHYEPMEY